MHRFLCFTACLSAACASAPGVRTPHAPAGLTAGQSTPPVTVVVARPAGPLTRQLRERLGSGVRLIGWDELARDRGLGTPAAGQRPAAATSLATVRADLAAARRQYQQIGFERAMALLDRAQAGLLPQPQNAATRRLLRELALERVLCLLALEAPKRAAQQLQLAFALGQGQPKAGEYSPEVTRFIERQRAARQSLKLAQLDLRSHPPQARLWVDGELRGSTPALLKLSPGTHWLRVERLGYRTRAQLVEIAPGQRRRLDLLLEGSPPAELMAQLPSARPQQIAGIAPDRLRRTLGSDVALLSLELAGAQRLGELLWIAPSPAPASLHKCAETAAGTLAECLERTLTRLAGRQPATSETHTRAHTTSPWFHNWWIWTAAGIAVAAGTGTAVYFGTRTPKGIDIYARVE